MATFQVKSDLPIATQKEIDRISAIASGQRTSVEANFLVSLSDYLYNGVDLRDEDENIVMAHGHTLPTGLSGFAKSSLFRKTDVATGTKALYENTGDVDSAVWNLVGQISGTEAQLDELAPVNAVNAYAVLTADTVTAGVRASNEIVSSGACAPASYATNTITSDGTNPAEDEVVVIGARTYRWRDTLAQADDVKIGATPAISLANLKKAVNGTGTEGVEYFADTVAHTLVIAGAIDATTLKVWSRTIGAGNNALTTTTTASHLSWADTTLGGGTGASDAGVATTNATIVIGAVTYTAVLQLAESLGLTAVPNQVLWVTNEATFLDNLKSAVNATAGAGTAYGTGTVEHPDVVATTNTDTVQTFVGRVTGTSLNTKTTTTTLANYAWADSTLGGGTGNSTAGVAGDTATIGSIDYLIVTDLSESVGADAVPNEVLYGGSDATALDNLKLAINGGATEGTNYATGTEQPVTVTAGTNTNTTQQIDAITAGVSGDGTESVSATGGLSWDDTELHGGVDGTLGEKGQQYINASYLYTAIDDNTITGKNWRRVSLGAVY